MNFYTISVKQNFFLIFVKNLIIIIQKIKNE